MTFDWSPASLDKRRCRHLPQHEVWTTQDKQKLFVCRMSDSHLENTIKYLQRRLDNGDYRMMDEAVILSAERYIATHDNEASHTLYAQRSWSIDLFGGPSDIDMFDGIDLSFEFSSGPYETNARNHLSILRAEQHRRKLRLRKRVAL